MSHPAASQRLSVVVPCFNEEEVIEATYRRLIEALEPLNLELELLFVDDGSRDRTEEKLRALRARDPRLQVILLARNFGHQVAVTAGIDAATGDAVVLIDADLQDPPEVIPQMVRLWRAGTDVVYGRRTEREGETAFKLVTARWFYRIIQRLADIEMPLDTGDFRLLDRKVVEALRQMPEQDRFLRGMVCWAGFRQMALPYKRDRRLAGDSKYPLSKMLRLAMDGVVSFSMKPLRLATLAGFACLLVALLCSAGLALSAVFQPQVPIVWLAVFGGMAFFASLQLISLGILGEYVGRIHRQSKQRPLYLVRERLGNALPVRAAAAERAA